MKERDSLDAKPKGLLQFSTEHGCHNKECQQHLKYRNHSQYFSSNTVSQNKFSNDHISSSGCGETYSCNGCKINGCKTIQE